MEEETNVESQQPSQLQVEPKPPQLQVEPGKPPTKKTPKWVWLLVVIGIAVVIGPFMSSDDNQLANQKTSTQPVNQQNQQAQNSSTATKQPQQQQQAVATTGTSSNVVIEVLGMETMDTIEGRYDTEKAKGIFKIVHVKVTNNQKDAISLSSGSYKLFDDQGREFSYSSDGNLALAMNDQETFSFDDLNPGLTTDGYIVFDVPKDAKGFKLQAQGGMTGEKIWLKVE